MYTSLSLANLPSAVRVLALVLLLGLPSVLSAQHKPTGCPNIEFRNDTLFTEPAPKIQW